MTATRQLDKSSTREIVLILFAGVLPPFLCFFLGPVFSKSKPRKGGRHLAFYVLRVTRPEPSESVTVWALRWKPVGLQVGLAEP